MGWIVSTILAVIVCGGLSAVGIFLVSAGSVKNSYGEEQSTRGLGRILLAVGISLFGVWMALSTILASVHQVDAGHVGVVRSFGDINDQTNAGLTLIWPWQSLEEASVRVQKEELDDIAAFSAETQDVLITATVNYQVSPRAVQRLYTEVGPDYVVKLLEPRLINFMKETTVDYAAIDIAPNREEIRNTVRDLLRKDLEAYSIDIVDLLIRSIDFNPEFKAAIEAKQVATQEALRQQQLIEANKAQAQQKIETARGDAESVLIAARAQAEANTLLAASLTEQVIRFQALQKLADNIQIALIPSGQGLIIDPATLLEKLSE